MAYPSIWYYNNWILLYSIF